MLMSPILLFHNNKMIKRFFIVLSLLIFLSMSPFFQGEMSRLNRDRGVLNFSVFAIYTIDSNISSSSASPSAVATSSTTATSSATANQSPWDKFINFLSGFFNKTDYSISSRELTAINTDMNDYGDLSDSNFSNKHSFAGSRLTSGNSQKCLKGNVIKQVILATTGYPDSEIKHICIDSTTNKCSLSTEKNSNCQSIKVSDLAHYLVQLQKQIYCDDNNNKLIDTESNILNKINEMFTKTIPTEELSCYQAIYHDFYITPKDSVDLKEENANKIGRIPIPARSQDKTLDIKATNNQVNKFLTPADYLENEGGSSGLFPEGWKTETSL